MRTSTYFGRFFRVAALLTAVALPLLAHKKPFHRAQVLRMQADRCGFNSSSGLLASVVGAGNNGHKDRMMLCRDYTLRAGDVLYTIRPKDHHARLLPLDQPVLYRLDKYRMKVEFADRKHKKTYLILGERPAGPSPCKGQVAVK